MCNYFADQFGRRAALLVGIILVAGGIFGEVFATADGAFFGGQDDPRFWSGLLSDRWTDVLLGGKCLIRIA